MNTLIKTHLILTVILLFGGLTMTACTASDKAANYRSSAGGTEQTRSANDDDRQSENKAEENNVTAKKEILWDFRKFDDTKPQEFSKPEADAVVKYLFGETSSKIEIRNRLSGAFTKPDAKETLYYLTGCKDEESGQFTTNCPHVSWDTVGWIAIYDGMTPVLKINKALGSSITKITDVNGDGKNEFLSVGGYAQSGIQTEGIAIGQISDGNYEAIKGFNGYAYNCAFGGSTPADKLSVKAVVISYIPAMVGKMPEFTEEYFKAKCKPESSDSSSVTDLIDQSSWEKITKKEFDEFFDSLS